MGLQRYILPFALVCGFIFYFADTLLKKIKESWIIMLAEPVISFGVLYIGYQVVYIFTRGEFLKWQFINGTCLLISFSIVMVRFLIRYQTIKIGQAISEKDTKITQQNELLVRAQLNALQARINPHFLYNALNSIAELARISASRTEEMALALSNLFRYNVNREESVFSTISEEMEMINLYLFVEKQRFNEKLNYLVDVDKTLEKVEIPKFLLQPLVENAVKHGISKITDNGCIKIEIKRVDQTIEIKIFDNGPDFPEGIINGYGLQNTYDKLDLIYQKPYEIRFISGEQKHILITLKK
jgi:LytS/YehU family sensor histidine kinase